MASDLFGPSLSTPEMLEATSGRAWLQAMLDFEGALARAEAGLGIIPADAAERIAAACSADLFDLDSIAARAPASASLAVPLVHDLTGAAGAAGAWVHWGATTQDVQDTAAMLVACRGLELLLGDLERAAAAAAELARRHRDTPMAARTLLQQALPTTFGLKAAGWLAGLLEARRALAEYRGRAPAVQLGGAAGTLAALGDRGLEVAAALARELGLGAPSLPWHTQRWRTAELGGVLALVAGSAGKPALDVILLAQTEVGEVSEAPGQGRGASSTLPQKRNPAGALLALAAARSAQAAAWLLPSAMLQEQERSPGWWQVEGEALGAALRFTAGAAGHLAAVLEGLVVDPGRMRDNLELTGGLLLAESVMMRLGEKVGRGRAHELVGEAARRAQAGAGGFRAELLAEPEVEAALGAAGIDAALDPGAYLGAARQLVDRTLAEYESTIGRKP